MVCVLAACLAVGCRLSVSLTGGTIDPRAKTVAIATFPNNASLVNPTLSQYFTTALKDKIQGQTPLTIVNNHGDYEIEGEIINYSVAPVAIQGNETAAMNGTSTGSMCTSLTLKKVLFSEMTFVRPSRLWAYSA